MKTLIVQYLPRGERSHTAKLLESFLAEANLVDYEIVDLCLQIPDMFLVDNLMAYIFRNYVGEEITREQQRLLEKADAFCATLLTADKLVLAFPMHNFSEPAIVKAWFDSVMQKGKTFNYDQNGYQGLLKAKKALILQASGGVYQGERESMEHAVSLAKTQLSFMGIADVQSICARGMNLPDGKAEERLLHAAESAADAGKSW